MKFTALIGLLTIAASVFAQPPVSQQRARIRGGGGPDGKCTIEVDVDDIAEVEISGDNGRLRTLAGGPAVWRRFECSSPMPPNMGDFRFSGVDGRGRQTLVRDPRNNRGVAVIRIEDPKGGREGYTFDVEWRAGGGGFDRRDDRPRDDRPRGPVGPVGPGDRGGYGGAPPPNRITVERAIAVCQEAVVSQLERDGYRGMRFERVVPEDNPSRRDWIVGSVEGRRRDYTDRFSFSCSVDFSSGKVRSADVTRRR